MFTIYSKTIIEKASQIHDDLVQIRRTIHANPELGYQEHQTADLIIETLESLNIDVQHGIGGTGVLGTLTGKHPGKTVLLRADMDCLSIQESNDVSYKSKKEGLMHACGHDAHVSWLLGAAMILAQMKDSMAGTVKFLFQPAEEGLFGARKCIEDGILDNPKVDAVFGAHVWAECESGTIGVKTGPLMSGPGEFNITIHGKGGHGAQPHNTNDPISIACQVYSGLQSIVSRRIDPTDSAVLSIATIHGGTANNITPDFVEMGGTVRVMSRELSSQIPQRMKEISEGIAEANGGACTFNYMQQFPVLVNTAAEVELAAEAGRTILGESKVVFLEKPSMASEDFAYYLERVPGAFFFIGTKSEAKGLTFPLHNAKFNIDEDILSKASAVFAQIAISYLNRD